VIASESRAFEWSSCGHDLPSDLSFRFLLVDASLLAGTCGQASSRLVMPFRGYEAGRIRWQRRRKRRQNESGEIEGFPFSVVRRLDGHSHWLPYDKAEIGPPMVPDGEYQVPLL